MTPEEKHIWYDFLKNLPVTVYRQKIIGDYIVDFYIHSAKIVIEIDGIQHNESEAKKADERRDADLKKLGINVLRYSNDDVNKRFTQVCNNILEHLGLKARDLLL